MNISANKVVSIDYTLKDDSGATLDSSAGRQPLSYMHGSGQIIVGLEKALEGKTIGDSISVSIKPEEAYGKYDETLLFKVEKDKFQNIDELEVGMRIQAQSQDGVNIFIVKAIEADVVTLDANHPLAGQNLNFDVSIKDVRDASKEELETGKLNAKQNG
jgi:FKBP-type peptidyl-prolyl cis-trans isomerase SlyD